MRLSELRLTVETRARSRWCRQRERRAQSQLDVSSQLERQIGGLDLIVKHHHDELKRSIERITQRLKTVEAATSAVVGGEFDARAIRAFNGQDKNELGELRSGPALTSS